MLLSIVIPVYNEEKSLKKILDKLIAVKLITNIEKELIIVNDASSDKSLEIINDFIAAHPENKIEVINKERNEGKGAALRLGFKKAQGDFIVIQDADLEYDPEDFNNLLHPLIRGNANVVYGSRFVKNKTNFLHYNANKFLTQLANIVNGTELSDMETCYKAFQRKLLDKFELYENSFGIEPELTAKFSQIENICIKEVAISYNARSKDEGKKITYKDGLKAIYCIFKYGFSA